jgi:hypothetical protein
MRTSEMARYWDLARLILEKLNLLKNKSQLKF